MDWSTAQSYQAHFAQALAKLRDERRYRVFANLERHAGRFPRATWLPRTRALADAAAKTAALR